MIQISWPLMLQAFLLSLPGLVTSIALLLGMMKVFYLQKETLHKVNSQQDALNLLATNATRAQGKAEGRLEKYESAGWA